MGCERIIVGYGIRYGRVDRSTFSPINVTVFIDCFTNHLYLQQNNFGCCHYCFYIWGVWPYQCIVEWYITIHCHRITGQAFYLQWQAGWF